MARVVVIGAGIAGTAAALFLARQHAVTVIDRDDFTPSGDLDVDFFRHRPRVPQAVQPHGLLAPVRSVLRAEAPDVYAAMLDHGASEHHELDWFAPRPPAYPGDDDLVTLRARRIVLETALRDALAHQPHVELHLAHAATGLLTDVDGEVPHVTGVATRSGHLPADLVIDASGRRSPVAGWLAAAGCRAPVIEQQRTRIAYFCRWYRLPTTGPATPGQVADDGGAPFARSLVFPSDNRTLAIALALAADHYRCVRCGSPENLVLDHIDGPDSAPDNLQTWCSSCHDTRTTEYITPIPDGMERVAEADWLHRRVTSPKPLRACDQHGWDYAAWKRDHSRTITCS